MWSDPENPGKSSAEGANARPWAHPCALRFASLAALLLLFFSGPVSAGTPIDLYQSFAGNLDFVTTGATFRTSGTSQCNVGTTASATIAGIPSGATVVAAYLYWAASTDSLANVDSVVTFDLQVRTADRTFTETFPYNGDDHYFYSGFDDVTDVISPYADPNRSYTMTGLTIHTGSPQCDVSAVLGGWSLIVIYEEASEPLRVVNVWDGFRYFRASQIILSPTNFRVPDFPDVKDGKLGHLSWEGDEGNSQNSGTFSEQLAFDGGGGFQDLVNSYNPNDNQFNSTVSDPTAGQTDIWGVDVDIYDITNTLTYGSTTANTLYQSGNDLVLLTAEVFSVTNTAVADLEISKSHSGDFVAAVDNDYTITVTNNGPSAHSGLVTVTDNLPAGVTAVSASGTGWSCTITPPGDVSCTRSDGLANGASYPDITLTVNAASSVAPSFTNTATVAGTSFDNISSNDSDSDPTNVLVSDLSTSTKTVFDPNGGDAEPGDVLQYTITLVESAGVAASDVLVTDDMPPSVSGFSVTSVPSGATDTSTGTGGVNNTGYLDVQDISVPASGSVTIVFEVTIDGGLAPGSTIDNTATITNPTGTGATPAAPTVIISQSSITGGVKPLYLREAGSPNQLSRTPPTGTPASFLFRKDTTPSHSWVLTPSLQSALTLDVGNIPAVLQLQRGGTNTATVSRQARIDITSSSLGLLATAEPTFNLTQTITEFSVNVVPTFTSAVTLPAGDVITVTITNTNPTGTRAAFRLYPENAGGYSRVELNSLTVINVDSVEAYDAAYSGGSIPSSFYPSTTAYVRAVVSDPFGSFDITSASVEIFEPDGDPAASGSGAMTEVADSGAATKTYQFAFSVPASPETGSWTIRVTALEGTENDIQDVGNGTFDVSIPLPDILVLKSVSVIDDPVNGSSNPKAIPGANVLYIIRATNQGPGDADAGSIVILDVLPPELDLYVDDLINPGEGPIALIDGSTASGLTLPLDFGGLGDPGDEVEFDDGSGNYIHAPTSTGGYDASVRAIRVSPSGPFNGAAGAPYPSFEIRMRARVK